MANVLNFLGAMDGYEIYGRWVKGPFAFCIGIHHHSYIYTVSVLRVLLDVQGWT